MVVAPRLQSPTPSQTDSAERPRTRSGSAGRSTCCVTYAFLVLLRNIWSQKSSVPAIIRTRDWQTWAATWRDNSNNNTARSTGSAAAYHVCCASIMDDDDLYGDLDTSRNALKLKSVSVELIPNFQFSLIILTGHNTPLRRVPNFNSPDPGAFISVENCVFHMILSNASGKHGSFDNAKPETEKGSSSK